MRCVWLAEASHQSHLERRGFATIVLEIDRFSKMSCLFLTKFDVTNWIIHNKVITKRWPRWDGGEEDNNKEDNEDMIKMMITPSAIIVLMVADSNPPGPTTGKRILSLKSHFQIVRILRLLFTESHIAETLLLTLKTLPHPLTHTLLLIKR